MQRKLDVNYQAPSYFPKRINIARSATLYSYPFKREPNIKSNIECAIDVESKQGEALIPNIPTAFNNYSE